MTNIFPEMYRNVNKFYIYIKSNHERKSESDKHIIDKVKIPIVSTQKPDIKDIRKVWETNVVDDEVLRDYLFSLEKIWPSNQYKFSQELILLLLKKSNFDFEVVRNVVTNVGAEFKNLVRKDFPMLVLKK